MSTKEYRDELICRSVSLSKSIFKLTDKLPSRQSYSILSNQLLRACTSIGANIFEAQAASSKKDFIYFLNISLKSANETKYWLVLLKEAKPDISNEIDSYLLEVISLSRMLGSSIIKLKKNL